MGRALESNFPHGGGNLNEPIFKSLNVWCGEGGKSLIAWSGEGGKSSKFKQRIDRHITYCLVTSVLIRDQFYSLSLKQFF